MEDLVWDLIIGNLYSIVLTTLFVCVYFYFRYKIRLAEKRKLKSLKGRDLSDAVETDSPVDDQEYILRQKGIHGIEDRFSFIQKALPVLLAFIWAILIFIPYLGKIPSVYVSIITAVFSVIAGLSLRPFLENLFSGIVISFFKSIKIGDTVMIDDHYGIIEEIGLTYSIVKRWDWNRVVYPNSKLLQKEIQNFTMNDQYLWTHIKFFVSPESDIAKVENIAKKVATEANYFNRSEEPSFWVMDMQKDAIQCWLAAWADNPSDAWELRNILRTDLIKALQKEGIKFHKMNFNQIL
ncbi:MAG: hypothetical protein CME66_09890 [Halobacteriovoraceae bacterium]|jgi:small-conductance mechanosensitive channel|nr:hypothetical protein [Halobacteriovoraceae bacterium]|tara:strand:+ start:559 stop:1440 length:882 start_codon:yes stop_codon:yes gene_type:complete